MTPLIINQEPKVHLKIHKQIKHLSIACALITTLLCSKSIPQQQTLRLDLRNL